MSFERWGYLFEGPWEAPARLRSFSGVYVIWGRTSRGEWYVVDVGESDNVLERVLNHERKACWNRSWKGSLYYAATYTTLPEQYRRQMEQEIRTATDPACGES